MTLRPNKGEVVQSCEATSPRLNRIRFFLFQYVIMHFIAQGKGTETRDSNETTAFETAWGTLTGRRFREPGD